MNGLETVEQRRAHGRALVSEVEDIKRALREAKQALEKTPESSLVTRARRQERILRLEKRLKAAEEQVAAFGVSGRAPHRRAESRGGRPPKREPGQGVERRA